VPFALSETALKVPVDVPPVAEKVTVAPPVVMVFPPASFAVSVTTTPEPERTVLDPTVTIELARFAGPGTTVRVGRVDVIAVLLTVPPTVVAVPETNPVNEAL
jgi:hypothetical protein